MTANIVLLIVSVLLISAALFSYFGYLKIANTLFLKVTGIDDNTTTSPYSIVRKYDGYYEKNYYYIYKNNNQITDKKHLFAKSAQDSLNELEKLEGYKPTKVA